jgi:hypothetical protein
MSSSGFAFVFFRERCIRKIAAGQTVASIGSAVEERYNKNVKSVTIRGSKDQLDDQVPLIENASYNIYLETEEEEKFHEQLEVVVRCRQ